MQPPISQQKSTSSIRFHFLKHIWTRCLICVKQERRREGEEWEAEGREKGGK